MEKTETLESFYRVKLQKNNMDLDGDEVLFNMLDFSACVNGATMLYRRRDYYKVCFLNGSYLVHYGDKSLKVQGTTLIFFSPEIPYTVEALEESKTGSYFIFRDTYLNQYYKNNVRDLPIFARGYNPIFMLDKDQEKVTAGLFDKMQKEMSSGYKFKHDLIRNAIIELMHFAMKMEPKEDIYQAIDARVRVTAVFNELIDRQFPINSIEKRFTLNSANDFATKMNIHVNYLNRAIKAVTGKTTTEHIFERLISESIIMLKHTHWSVREISYALGFADPSHFNHFFKKQTNNTPSNYRHQSENPIQGL